MSILPASLEPAFALLSRIGLAWAPLHELGHVLAGWISLNPTYITGWAESVVTRNEAFVSIGGYTVEAIGLGLIGVWISRRKHPIARRLWPTIYIALASTAADLAFQTDIDPLSEAAPFAYTIWLAAIITSAAFLTHDGRRARWTDPTTAGRAESRPSPRSSRTETPAAPRPGPSAEQAEKARSRAN